MKKYFEKKEKVEYFQCSCFSPDHLLRFTRVKWEEDEPTELYIHVFLHKEYRFFRRILDAFKYIFYRNPCRYGNVDEFIFRNKDINGLIKFLEEYRDIHYEEKQTLNPQMFRDN